MKKGFTLIELLAVLVILVVIAAIATPIVMGIINDTKTSADLTTINNMIDTAEQYYAQSELSGNLNEIININIINDENYKMKDKPENAIVKVNQNGTITVIYHNNETCYEKKSDSEILLSNKALIHCLVLSDNSGANIPELNDDLVPVTIKNDGTIIYADASEKWYDYTEQIWANAVTIKDGISINIGDEISLDYISQMYVWIPRYSYNEDSITSSTKPIDISFTTANEDAHIAFTFGNTEISGFWIGKFENSLDVIEESSVDLSTTEFIIKPNVNSAHNMNVSKMYEISNNASTKNSNVHMLKNTEWGAVAYLSQSIYGICDEETCDKVANNAYYEDGTSYDLYTGCGPISESDYNSGSISICPDDKRWNTEIGNLASTTHNITGVYDMAGGRWEYVMGNMLNSSGNFSSSSSGLSVIPDSKYYDIYSYGTSQSDSTRYILGDATMETKSWNSDAANFVTSSSPWFLRGGRGKDASGSGVFSYTILQGQARSDLTSRSSLIVV